MKLDVLLENVALHSRIRQEVARRLRQKNVSQKEQGMLLQVVRDNRNLYKIIHSSQRTKEHRTMATAYTPQAEDPFSGGSRTPSLSWKGLAIGAVFTLEILEPAKLLHSRNFESNEPDYWDPPTNTQPKMSAVVNVRVVTGPHSVGEERSIWAQKPSNLFVAIAQAQQTAGAKIAPGGTLHLKFAGEMPHENKRYSPIKQYQAKYEPPQGSADAFSAPPEAGPAQQPQYAQPVPQGWPQAAPQTLQPVAVGATAPRARTW